MPETNATLPPGWKHQEPPKDTGNGYWETVSSYDHTIFLVCSVLCGCLSKLDVVLLCLQGLLALIEVTAIVLLLGSTTAKVGTTKSPTYYSSICSSILVVSNMLFGCRVERFMCGSEQQLSQQ